MIREWKLQPRSRTCDSCKKPFEEGDLCHSALVELNPAEIERLDLCQACWKQSREEKTVSSWNTTIQPVKPPAPLPLEFHVAEALLERWSPADSEDARHGCFILSALLERKRLLVARSSFEQDGKLFTVFEHRQSGKTYVIEKIQLGFQDLEKVQTQVMNLLHEAAGDEELLSSPEADSQIETA
jgi:hypothetical protein